MARWFLMWIAVISAQAALTEAQRVQDLQALASIYAKSYAPANWKIVSLNVNIFELSPWVARVRGAKSDLEHVQILMEYAASFKDTHTQVTMPTNFVADLGFYCDLYDGKVLIDQIDRSLLPSRNFPFVTGDELVSLDGKPALEVARELERGIGWGNPRAQLRYAVAGITYRAQSQYPLAALLPEASQVVIRRQSGTLETYTINWDKSGYAIKDLGAASSPFVLSEGLKVEEVDAETLEVIRGERPFWRRAARLQKISRLPRQLQARPGKQELVSVRGFGSRTPVWTPPAGFVQRLGRGFNDIFFSGTYVSDGFRIGYIRIRDFDFSTDAELSQLANEVIYMNANTDGLVLDVMRNPGGFACTAIETAAMIIPTRFTVGGDSIRPSLSWLQYYDSLILDAEFYGDPDWAIAILKAERDLLVGAFTNGRGMTGAIPICGYGFTEPSYSFAYTKPLILLTDDYTTSAADHFAHLIQDNARGKLVGTRTNGAGGTVTETKAGGWSELSTTFTESVMMRSKSVKIGDFPESPFVENVGVQPDIELDYMTGDNLVNSGRTFVGGFTKAIVDQIRASRPPSD